MFAKLPITVFGSARRQHDPVVWQGCSGAVFGPCCITKGCFAAKNPYLKMYFLSEHVNRRYKNAVGKTQIGPERTRSDQIVLTKHGPDQ